MHFDLVVDLGRRQLVDPLTSLALEGHITPGKVMAVSTSERLDLLDGSGAVSTNAEYNYNFT